MNQITVVARVKVRPGKMDELEPQIVQLMEHTHREDGCLHYSVHRGIDPADELVTIERWEERRCLDEHMKMPFLQDLLARIPEYIFDKPEIHVFRQSEGGDPGLARIEH